MTRAPKAVTPPQSDASESQHNIDLPEPAETRTVRIAGYAFHSGPLPDASSFRKYEEVLPGAAERLLVMAERQQEFEHNIAKAEQNNYFKGQARGVWVGTAGLFLMAILGAWMAANGHTGFACLLIGAPIMTVLNTIIQSWLTKKTL